MRPLAALICAAALALGVSACGGGGSKDNAQTIAPAPLTVPGGETAPPITDTGASGASGATGATGSSSTSTPSSSPGSSGTGTPSGGSQGSSPQQSAPPSGGTQAPSSGTKGGGTHTTPTTSTPNGGASPQFCKENPGAC